MKEQEIKKMNELESVAGDRFEDMTIAEMVEVQGSGDMQAESTPACAIVIISAAIPSAVGSINIARTIKGKC